MDLLEEMERQQKGLSDENSVLREENEAYLNEVARLSAILAAREQVPVRDDRPGLLFAFVRLCVRAKNILV